MRIGGILLAILGGLMVLSGLHLALTKYDLGSSHDMSKLAGSLSISLLMLVGGVAMAMKADPKDEI